MIHRHVSTPLYEFFEGKEGKSYYITCIPFEDVKQRGWWRVK